MLPKQARKLSESFDLRKSSASWQSDNPLRPDDSRGCFHSPSQATCSDEAAGIDDAKSPHVPLEGNTRCGIDLRDDERINEATFWQLIRAAVVASNEALVQRVAKKKAAHHWGHDPRVAVPCPLPARVSPGIRFQGLAA